ncbi:hypothetical protein K466DRAFT_585060 [Polyporus arcularius HHB13444]|uniref:Uncharacterized protein n=1 Tax=Polyporus arcularius HHB13444 TaxID=1314778 RepID=A0A5C3PGT8_9APHY|nr:hypothetical protein K466DRAFT_585060 [Polyporus arcularius HHB13444]
MAYSLADPRHVVSNERDSAVRYLEDWSLDNVLGDTSHTSTAGGSITPQFRVTGAKSLTTRQTSTSSPGVSEAPTSGIPVAAIVGASVAGAVVLLVAGLCVYFLWWRRRKPRGRASVVKDEEMVHFPDTRPLIDHTDIVTFPTDSDAHPLTLSPDPDAHVLAYPETPPLLGSTQRGYFPSAPASERSTPVVASASLSAMSASSGLSRGDAEPDLGPLAALGEAARGRMEAGVVDAPRGGGKGAGVGPVADSGTVHVAEGASPVHAGYDIHSAVRLHSMHASVALASRVSASAVPTTSAGSAVSRDSTRTATQPRMWDEAVDGA